MIETRQAEILAQILREDTFQLSTPQADAFLRYIAQLNVEGMNDLFLRSVFLKKMSYEGFNSLKPILKSAGNWGAVARLGTDWGLVSLLKSQSRSLSKSL
jgi:hypothetical protein